MPALPAHPPPTHLNTLVGQLVVLRQVLLQPARRAAQGGPDGPHSHQGCCSSTPYFRHPGAATPALCRRAAARPPHGTGRVCMHSNMRCVCTCTCCDPWASPGCNPPEPEDVAGLAAVARRLAQEVAPPQGPVRHGGGVHRLAHRVGQPRPHREAALQRKRCAPVPGEPPRPAVGVSVGPGRPRRGRQVLLGVGGQQQRQRQLVPAPKAHVHLPPGRAGRRGLSG